MKLIAAVEKLLQVSRETEHMPGRLSDVCFAQNVLLRMNDKLTEELLLSGI
jgi:hypothetical protein